MSRPSCPSFRRQRGARRQAGFAIVSAIFLLVVLALLGAYMVSFTTIQTQTSAQEVQSTRAYWTARSAIQWAMGVIASSGACPAAGASPALAGGFSVAVNCSSHTYDEIPTTRTIYRLRATVSGGGAVGSATYVERQVDAIVE